jgi:hypothetical protein
MHVSVGRYIKWLPATIARYGSGWHSHINSIANNCNMADYMIR